MTRRVNVGVLFLLVMLLGAIPGANGQTSSTGQIAGVVTDPSGAVIPGAKVTVREPATGMTRAATANAVGRYTVPLLSAGTYEVTVTANGFRTFTDTNIAVDAATSTTVNAKLIVGAATQQVIVESGAEMLQTEDSAVGNTVDQTAILDLPLVNRNYTQILQLNTGIASSLPNAAGLGTNTVDVNANGGMATDNSYEMDGLSVTNIQKGQTGGILSEGNISIPSPDAIEQFREQTSQYDAAYGNGSGANVDVVTKSGTNKFHGDAFEFNRNNVFNANDYFLKKQHQARPELKQNQFGGTAGGPILHDKLFFFASYEGTRQVDAEGNSSQRGVTLPLLGSTAASRTAAALGAEFAGETGLHGTTPIAPDGSNINPVAVALLNFKLPNGQYLIPAPQTVVNASNLNSGGLSAFSSPSTYSEDQGMLNLDWTPTAKQHLALKYFMSRAPESQAFSNYSGSTELPGAPVEGLYENDNASLKYTYIFDPNLINEFTLGQSRIDGTIVSGFPVDSSQIGMTADCDNPQAPTIADDTFSMGGSFDDSQYSDVKNYSLVDQLSYVHGKHSMQAGFAMQAVRYPFQNTATSRGEVTFYSFSDFLLGMNAAGNGGTVGDSSISATSALCGITKQKNRDDFASAYFQDNWTVTRHLTLNLGLRWEIFGQASSDFGQMVNVWPSLINNAAAVSGSTLSGWVVAKNFPGTIPAGVLRNSNNTFAGNAVSLDNIDPRLGFSWNPVFAQKLVLRGGFGIYRARTSVSDSYQLTSDQPFNIRVNNSASIAGGASFQDPWCCNAPPDLTSDYPIWQPLTYLSTQSPAIIQPNWAPPREEQYNLNVQYAVIPSMVLEVGYVGNHESNIEGTVNIDQSTLTLNPALASVVTTFTGPTTSNLQDRRPYLGYSALTQYSEFGIANYNSLQVTLRKRLTHQIQFGVAYTYSKALSDVTGNGTFAGGAGGLSGDNSNPMQAYGPTGFNIPQRLVTSFLWDLPSPGKNNAIAHELAGGWEFSGVLSFQDGFPVTFSNSHITSIYGGSSRAELCPGVNTSNGYSTLVTPGSTENKLNDYFGSTPISCLPPAIGNAYDWGNTKVGIASAPGERDADLEVMKDIYILGERRNDIQIRGEFYNAFNWANFSGPGTNVGSPGSFGVITSTALNPRIIQVGMKYIF
ncbi:MAG: carboxypeptidase regulatory-like domain-containing protein [Terracidiphilus sp.]